MPARRCVSWEPFAADTRRAGEGVRPSVFPAQVPRQRHHLLVERPDVGVRPTVSVTPPGRAFPGQHRRERDGDEVLRGPGATQRAREWSGS